MPASSLYYSRAKHKKKGGSIIHNHKGNRWTGFSSLEFKPYKNWINRKHPGVCGTYASAVLLHHTVKKTFDKSMDQAMLLDGLEPIIENRLPYKGTFPWDLANGLNDVLTVYPDWHARWGMIPDKQVVKSLSGNDPRPVGVGTTKLLNSRYNNHWLVVYAYRYNQQNQLLFKAYDNHGRYRTIVKAAQTFGYVYIEQPIKK